MHRLQVKAICPDNTLQLKSIAELIINEDPSAFIHSKDLFQSDNEKQEQEKRIDTLYHFLKREIPYGLKADVSLIPLILGAYLTDNDGHTNLGALVGAVVMRPLWGLSGTCELQSLAINRTMLSEQNIISFDKAISEEIIIASLARKALCFFRKSNPEASLSLFSFRQKEMVRELKSIWSALSPEIAAVINQRHKKADEPHSDLVLLHMNMTDSILPVSKKLHQCTRFTSEPLSKLLDYHFYDLFQHSYLTEHSNFGAFRNYDAVLNGQSLKSYTSTPLHRSPTGVVSLVTAEETEKHHPFKQIMAPYSESGIPNYYLLPLSVPYSHNLVINAAAHGATFCGLLPISQNEQYLLCTGYSEEATEQLMNNYNSINTEMSAAEHEYTSIQ